MASIEEVSLAAYRVQQSASNLGQRSLSSADRLAQHAGQLQSLVQGSRTGMEALAQVSSAQRQVRESIVALGKLERDIENFIQDLTK